MHPQMQILFLSRRYRKARNVGFRHDGREDGARPYK